MQYRIAAAYAISCVGCKRLPLIALVVHQSSIVVEYRSLMGMYYVSELLTYWYTYPHELMTHPIPNRLSWL